MSFYRYYPYIKQQHYILIIYYLLFNLLMRNCDKRCKYKGEVNCKEGLREQKLLLYRMCHIYVCLTTLVLKL